METFVLSHSKSWNDFANKELYSVFAQLLKLLPNPRIPKKESIKKPATWCWFDWGYRQDNKNANGRSVTANNVQELFYFYFFLNLSFFCTGRQEFMEMGNEIE